VKMSEKNGVYYVEHVLRERGGPADVERMILNTAIADTQQVRISIPQDPGQSAKTQVLAYAKLLAGFDVRFSTESSIGGGKQDRAMPVSAQAEVGNIKIVKGPWNDAFLEEICTFPAGTYKDQTDALSRAFAELLRPETPTALVGTFQMSR
jgi:predicted phage terminase large subunit-like protein